MSTETHVSSPPGDRVAADLRGFGPLALVAILVIIAGNFIVAPLSAMLVLAWAWRSRTPWQELGFVRPTSWARTVAVGILFGVAFKLSMKAVVMPLLGANPINQTYHYLVGNTAALPAMLLVVIVSAGFGEETLFRGYMFERLSKLFGRSAPAMASIVLLTSALFGAAHYVEQGRDGVVQGSIVGLVYGTIFAITGRLWMLIIAHAAFNVTALAVIYWNLESRLAHLIFG